MPNKTCDFLVISCIDFRIHSLVHDWLKEKLSNQSYDYTSFAGGIKNLYFAMEQLDISLRLHNIKEIIIIEHEDCGAYGNDGTKEIQIEDLHKAKGVISQLLPEISVKLFYLSVSSQFEEIH